MTFRCVISGALVALTCALSSGCGSKEKEAQERDRLELEEKTRREAEAANKAITEMNRSMFRRKVIAEPIEPAAGEPAAPDAGKEAPGESPETPRNP